MWRIGVLLVGAAMLVAGCTTGGTKVTSSWRDPQLVRIPHVRQVLVLARIQEAGTRRMLEDQTVAELRQEGISATPAYKTLPDMAEGDPAFRSLAKGAGADAIILYTPGQNYTDVANRPGLGAGVGFGMFGISLGPLIGGSKAEQRGTVDAQLYPATSAQPVWSAQYDVNLVNGVQKGMADVPGRAVKQIRADGAM